MILDSKDTHGVLPLGRGGNIFFALGGLCCGGAWWERVIWGEMLFFSLCKKYPSFSSLHTSQGKPACS